MPVFNRFLSFLLNESRICSFLGFTPATLASTVSARDEPELMPLLESLVSVDPSSLRISNPGAIEFAFTATKDVSVILLLGVESIEAAELQVSYASTVEAYTTGCHTYSQRLRASISSPIGLLVFTTPQAQDYEIRAQVYVLNISMANPITGIRLQVGASFYSLEKIYGPSGTPSEDEPDTSSRPCVICLGKTSSVLLMPCRHMALCRECSSSFRKRTTVCPICRGAVNMIIDIADIHSTLSSTANESTMQAIDRPATQP